MPYLINRSCSILVDCSILTMSLQVYSMLQGKRDVEMVLTMGIMEDVSIIPQPAGGDFNIISLKLWMILAAAFHQIELTHFFTVLFFHDAIKARLLYLAY